jgi:hypothetical protein
MTFLSATAAFFLKVTKSTDLEFLLGFDMMDSFGICSLFFLFLHTYCSDCRAVVYIYHEYV